MLAAPEKNRKKKDPNAGKSGWRRTASTEIAPDSRVHSNAA